MKMETIKRIAKIIIINNNHCPKAPPSYHLFKFDGKASFPIEVTEEGIATWFKDEHSLKA